MSDASPPLNPAIVAARLAEQLELRGQEYAVGGAIALGFWGAARGTIDVEQILRSRGAQFDHSWVREHLAEMYGPRDPRLAAWDDLVRETRAE